MIWFLLLCTHVHHGAVCTAPVQMPSLRACSFVSAQQKAVASTQWVSADVTTRCVGVPK